MTLQLKPLSPQGIPEALKKVERYRLLNEPSEAESICRDVLLIDPENQQVLVMLLLCLTDQIGSGLSTREAREIIPKLEREYDRCYYSGIICERLAKSQFRQGFPGSASSAYESFQEAMNWYERAERLRDPGNDDSILRWNACARILMRNPSLQPRPEEKYEAVLGE